MSEVKASSVCPQHGEQFSRWLLCVGGKSRSDLGSVSGLLTAFFRAALEKSGIEVIPGRVNVINKERLLCSGVTQDGGGVISRDCELKHECGLHPLYIRLVSS